MTSILEFSDLLHQTELQALKKKIATLILSWYDFGLPRIKLIV